MRIFAKSDTGTMSIMAFRIMTFGIMRFDKMTFIILASLKLSA